MVWIRISICSADSVIDVLSARKDSVKVRYRLNRLLVIGLSCGDMAIYLVKTRYYTKSLLT